MYFLELKSLQTLEIFRPFFVRQIHLQKICKKIWKLGDKNGKVCSFLKSKTSIFNSTDFHESFYFKQMKKTFIFILSAFLILPALSQSNQDLEFLRHLVSIGCLKQGKILTNSDRSKYVYRMTTNTSKSEVDFYPDMTYKFRDGSKSGKWTCPQLSGNSSNSSSSSSDAAVALFLGMLESSSGTSNNPSSYSNQNVHNSYQCNRCALVSRSTKEPSGADFGRCNGFSLLPTISSVSHDWNKANTNKGWQCTSCGIKSFLIKGEPGAWEFGGNGACNGGSHRWRSF